MSADPLILPALLRRNTEENSAKAAIVTDEGSISHAELDRESFTLARQLVGAGIGKSSRVGLLMENGLEWAVVAVAVMRTGAVLVPLSTVLEPPELHAQLRIATVTELVVTRQFRGRSYLSDLEAVAPGIMEVTSDCRRHPELPNLRRVWAADVLPSDRVDHAVVSALENRVRPSDDLVVLFTSGSRGAPEGTIHTHGGAIRATAAGLAARRVGTQERLSIPMPFFRTDGFSSGLMTALVAGAAVVTTAIAETELTTLGPGSLPAVLPAVGRPAPGARANHFGMTETFGPYCGERLDTDLPPDEHGSCGRPFEGVEVRILDPESGEECPPGVDGEIAVRGPNLMRGICGKTRAETFDVDGFYRTGDLGMLDADGYLWYRGRMEDVPRTATVEVAKTALQDLIGKGGARNGAGPTTGGTVQKGTRR